MDTQKKIITLLSGSFAFVLVIVLILLYMSQSRYEDIQAEDTKRREEVVKISLEQASKPLKNSLNDNISWQALIDLTNPLVKLTPKETELKWNLLELHTFFVSSKIQYIWVFNSKKKIVNSLFSSTSNPKIETPIPYTNVELALGAKKEFHFYLNEGGKIIEIAGNAMYRDSSKSGEPDGYLFFGKIVGTDMLKELETITDSKVHLFNNTYELFQLGDYQTVIYASLESWNDEAIARVAFVNFDQLESTQENHIYISLLIYFSLFVILIIYTFYRVKQIISNPLSKIMESLDEKSIEPIAEIIHQKNEFGKIAKLIANSYQQSKQIEEQYNKIQDQNSELEALNATKDKFFSIIAHDLRNPFGVILSTTEFISNPNYQFTKDELIDFSKDINHTAKTIFNLLENLLTWARSQHGNVPFDPEIISTNEILDTTRFVIDSQAEAKKINVECNASEELFCSADRNMLLTVIRNLCSNAIKFTPNGGKIELSANSIDDKNVEFRVKDNGVGISPENINKLFRIDVSVTTIGTSDEKGTGLGLILCKEFVEKNGGKIRVESEINKGTTFIFTVPKAQPQKDDNKLIEKQN